MKKVLFLLQNNCTDTVGGSITASINLINLLIDNSFQVVACCLRANTDNRPQKLSSLVKFVDLKGSDSKIYFNNLIKEEKPDVIVFPFPSLYVESNLDKQYANIPQIIVFHSRPDYYFNNNSLEYNLKKMYTSNTISVILCPSYIHLLPEFIQNNKVVCIPNSFTNHSQFVNIENSKNKIVYLSRIDKFKGHKFLLKSFSMIANKFPTWSIDIWGQSEPESYINDLKKYAQKLKIDNQVNFKGVTKTPLITLLNYDFCVFPSYFEGFPIGLTEALSVGLPAIGLKKCSGVNELIIDNENGFLVEYDYLSFAKKIEELMDNQNLRIAMSQKAIKYSKQYINSEVDKKWLNLFNNIETQEKFEIHKEAVDEKDLFKIDEILNMDKNKYLQCLQKIFTIKNVYKENRKIKTIVLLGIKIPIFAKNII